MSYPARAEGLVNRISPKVNVIARQEFVLAYHNDAVHGVSDYATDTFPSSQVTLPSLKNPISFYLSWDSGDGFMSFPSALT